MLVRDGGGDHAGVIAAGAAAMGVDMCPGAEARLGAYLEQLLLWNTRMNLVGRASPQTLIARHFLDSLSCLEVLPRTGRLKVVDVGAGAGFPGLVVAVARRAPTELLLVESSVKKAAFLEEVTVCMGVADVEVVRGRAETVCEDPRFSEAFDIAFCRGVGDLQKTARYCLPFLKAGGRMVAQRGPAAASEVAAAGLDGMGCPVEEVREIRVAGLPGPRAIVVARKKQ